MRGSFECIYADNTIFAHLGFSSVCTRGKHNPTGYRLVNHSFVPGSGRGALYIRSCVQAVGRTSHSDGLWGLSKIARLAGVRGGVGTEI